MGREASPRALLIWLAASAVLFSGLAAPARAEEARSVVVRGVQRTEVGVRFDLMLAEGLPPEQADRLDQGERVWVTWEVELLRDRRLWFNTTVAKLELRASAQFDPLTQRYSLERHVGKELVASAEAGQRAEAVEWLTRVAEALVPVAPKAFDKPRLKWRARAILDRKLVLLFVPTTVRTGWGKGEFADSGDEGSE